ncbi:MAG: DUF4140 domain-containing protein [Spirochaetia bacterium]|nr:DUF4140 domain-containing protein [Spirochaetia bacterium]
MLRADESPGTESGIPLVTTISEVQLYSDQALVRRRGRLDLAGGLTIFRVKNLPASLINDSVRMSLDGGGVRISEIRVETRHEKVFRSQQAKEADKLLREAESKLRRLTDEYNSIREEEAHIKAIRLGQELDKDKEKIKRHTASVDVFRDTLDFVQNSLKRNQRRMGELLQEIDKAREEMTVVGILHTRRACSHRKDRT